MESVYNLKAASVGPNSSSGMLGLSFAVVAVVVQLELSSRFSKLKQVASYSDPSHSLTATTPMANASHDSGNSSVH